MSHKARDTAFIRGFMSALELSPTQSRKASRDMIVSSQVFSVHSAWEQVGNLLREACGQQVPKEKGQFVAGRERF